MTNIGGMFTNCEALSSIIGGKTVASDGSIDGSTTYFGKGPKLTFSFNYNAN